MPTRRRGDVPPLVRALRRGRSAQVLALREDAVELDRPAIAERLREAEVGLVGVGLLDAAGRPRGSAAAGSAYVSWLGGSGWPTWKSVPSALRMPARWCRVDLPNDDCAPMTANRMFAFVYAKS